MYTSFLHQHSTSVHTIHQTRRGYNCSVDKIFINPASHHLPFLPLLWTRRRKKIAKQREILLK